ncbi:MAG: DMT family transporter [Paracoccaceae bacterium]
MTLAAEAERARPLLAAAWMVGAVASFSAMALAGRITYSELTTFELMFYRSAIGLMIVSVLIMRSNRGWAHIRSHHPGLHIQRNIVHFAGQNMWFYAVAVIPFAQVVAFEFTNPIWVALLAPFALGERWTRMRILCVGLGFIGILIVARPGQVAFTLGHLAAAGCALGFALNTIFTKRIMRYDTVLCVLFWMVLLQMFMGLFLSMADGVTWPTAALWPWVGLVGICGLSAHFCLTSALAAAPATVVAPMEFMRLPAMAAIGMLAYGEALEWAVFAGAALIVAANLLNIMSARRA